MKSGESQPLVSGRSSSHGSTLMRCCGAVPWAGALAWSIYILGDALVGTGSENVLEPLCPFGCKALKRLLGLARSFFYVTNFLISERLLSLKLGLRFPESCAPPCYGRAVAGCCHCIGTWWARLLLVASWSNIILALLLAALYTCIATVLLTLAFAYRQAVDVASEEALNPATVQRFVTVLNDPPFNANMPDDMNMTKVADYMMRNPSSVIEGGVHLIVGLIIVPFAEVVFLAAFTVGERASSSGACRVDVASRLPPLTLDSHRAFTAAHPLRRSRWERLTRSSTKRTESPTRIGRSEVSGRPLAAMERTIALGSTMLCSSHKVPPGPIQLRKIPVS